MCDAHVMSTHETHWRRRIAAAGITIGTLGILAGCVDSSLKPPVALHQRDATLRLVDSYDRDLQTLQSALDALLQIRMETQRAAIEASLLNAYVTASGDADSDALVAAIQNEVGALPDALVMAVRSGRLTLDGAKSWLTDYALAWRMHQGVHVRASLIAQLGALQPFKSARDAIEAAMAEHRTHIQRLAHEATASADALLGVYALEHEVESPTRGVLARFFHDVVLDDVRDPDARRELLAAFTNLIDSEFLPTERTEAPE